MPRFHFDITDTGRFMRDDEDIELPNHEEARKQALTGLADIAKDELPDGDFREFIIAVRDGEPEPLFIASLLLSVERRA